MLAIRNRILSMSYSSATESAVVLYASKRILCSTDIAHALYSATARYSARLAKHVDTRSNVRTYLSDIRCIVRAHELRN